MFKKNSFFVKTTTVPLLLVSISLFSLQGMQNIPKGNVSDLEKARTIWLHPGASDVDVFKKSGVITMDTQAIGRIVDSADTKGIMPFSVKLIDPKLYKQLSDDQSESSNVQNFLLDLTGDSMQLVDKNKDFLIVAGSHGDYKNLFEISAWDGSSLLRSSGLPRNLSYGKSFFQTNFVNPLKKAGITFKYILVEACVTGYVMNFFKELLAPDGFLLGSIPSTGSDASRNILNNYNKVFSEDLKKKLLVEGIGEKTFNLSTILTIASTLEKLNELKSGLEDWLQEIDADQNIKKDVLAYIDAMIIKDNIFKISSFIKLTDWAFKQNINTVLLNRNKKNKNAPCILIAEVVASLQELEKKINDYKQNYKDYWNAEYSDEDIKHTFEREYLFKDANQYKKLDKLDFDEVFTNWVSLSQLLNGKYIISDEDKKKATYSLDGLDKLEEAIYVPVDDIKKQIKESNIIQKSSVLNCFRKLKETIKEKILNNSKLFLTLSPTAKTRASAFANYARSLLDKEIGWVLAKTEIKDELSSTTWNMLVNNKSTLYSLIRQKNFIDHDEFYKKMNKMQPFFDKHRFCGMILFHQGKYYYEKWIDSKLGKIYSNYSDSGTVDYIQDDLKMIKSKYSSDEALKNAPFFPVPSLIDKLHELLGLDNPNLEDLPTSADDAIKEKEKVINYE